MVLNRDSILQALDLKREVVEVPEWGGTVILTELSAADRLKFGAAMGGKDDQRVFVAKALTWFIVDEGGDRIFTEDDADMLAGKSLPVLQRLWDVAAKLNAMKTEGDDEVKN